MKQGKYAAPVRRRRRRNTLKPMLIAMAVVLLLGCVTGGTLAWLTASTTPVTNTFTTSNIDITLAETKGGTNKEFKMIPGYTIEKDPKVTVVANSEDCWLFVKVEKSSNFGSFMTCEMATGWTQLTDATGNDVANVFCRKVTASTADQPFDVLKNNQVSVLSTVTKADMNALTSNTYPTLTVTAYASQLYRSAGLEFKAYEAWANVNPTT